jgi:hypothetical protein
VYDRTVPEDYIVLGGNSAASPVGNLSPSDGSVSIDRSGMWDIQNAIDMYVSLDMSNHTEVACDAYAAFDHATRANDRIVCRECGRFSRFVHCRILAERNGTSEAVSEGKPPDAIFLCLAIPTRVK